MFCGGSGVCHRTLPLMNIFTKTEAANFPKQATFQHISCAFSHYNHCTLCEMLDKNVFVYTSHTVQ